MIFQEKPSVCIPITTNPNKHQSSVGIIGMYFLFTDQEEKYINFTHPDEIDNELNLNDIVLHPKTVVFNKKALVSTLLHGRPHKSERILPKRYGNACQQILQDRRFRPCHTTFKTIGMGEKDCKICYENLHRQSNYSKLHRLL